MLNAMGQAYAELGRVRIVDTRHKIAIAHVEFSCEPIDPGDIAGSLCGKTYRDLPCAGALRSLCARQLGKPAAGLCWLRISTSELGTGAKVY